MSKYGDVIRQARQQETQTQENQTPGNQETGNPVNQQDGKTESQKSGLPDNSALATEKSEKPAPRPAVKPANATAEAKKGAPAPKEEKAEEVNLSIKVPKTLRRHWVSEAKRQDTTITAVIIGALKERFGEPAKGS